MSRVTATLFVIAFAGLFFDPSPVIAQGFGGFGGAGNYSGAQAAKPTGNLWVPSYEVGVLAPEIALNYITIVGTADRRVAPEGIRVVFAITSEAEAAQDCQEKSAAQVEAVLKAWGHLKISEKDVVEDFINVLPVYEWRLIDRDGQEFRVQQQKGFRMQANLHLAVKTEKDAMAAIKAAFNQGVTEIVTFEYWSSRLNDEKAKATAAALAAAQEKAKTLLAVFDAPPKIINIQESTQVFFPRSLYHTYENILEEESTFGDSWRNKPAIKAYRPKMTFYQGLESRSDVGATAPAMRPEIAVVSSVRIYYQSPADKATPGKNEK